MSSLLICLAFVQAVADRDFAPKDVETVVARFREGRERLLIGHFEMRKEVVGTSGKTVRTLEQCFKASSKTIDYGHLVKGFDVRTLGIVDLQDFFNDSPKPSFDSLVGALEGKPGKGTRQSEFSKVNKNNQEYYRLVSWNREERYYSEILLDPKQDFVPIEWREWTGDVEWPAADPRPLGEAARQMTINWELRNEVYVPTSAAYSSSVGRTKSIKLNFKWLGVNEPIEPGTIKFQIDSPLSPIDRF